jgi:copper(I)-binding protein
MTPHHRLLAASVLALATLAATAHGVKFGTIDIDSPHARATAAGQAVGGGYFKLVNGGAADKLVAARSPAAASVELHSMRMEGDVMRMRQVDAIELPAGQTVELKPGGLHLMLMGLKAPLKAGDSVPVTLRFEKAGEVTVQLKVEAPGASAPVHKH